jgi:predicted ATPase
VRIDSLRVGRFRNLRDFTIEFDEDRFTTVLIGENGTGKSNVLEAIILIFRGVDLGELPEFEFDISYTCHGNSLTISGRPGHRQSVIVDTLGANRKISWKEFQERKEEFLPKYIFAYYSGPSTRMQSYFDAHQRRFYDQILNDDSGVPPPIRRLFYCQPEHSRWVLLAYFLKGEVAPDFLRRYFGIDKFDSALLVLREPEWARGWSGKKGPPADTRVRGDERFWWARGVVKSFLQRLWEESMAPIFSTENHVADYRAKPAKDDRLYLYIADAGALGRLRDQYSDEAALFAALESTDISQLIRDVRVRVYRGEESILFSDMSEGEQQLLTVVGLMQFTRHEESLFLLDEPDTHLNPMWKLKYLQELARHAGFAGEMNDEESDDPWQDKTSQLILTTHDPLTIAGLKKNEVQIFERVDGFISPRQPIEDPRGLGVAGVLLEMFGLPTTLDLLTQRKIEKRNQLSRQTNRTAEEEEELNSLSRELAELGLAYEARDPEYRRFLRAVHTWEQKSGSRLGSLPAAEQERIVMDIVGDLLGSSVD